MQSIDGEQILTPGLIHPQHLSNNAERFNDLEGLLVLQGVLDEKIQLSNVPALNIRLGIYEMAGHQSDVVESIPMKDLFI